MRPVPPELLQQLMQVVAPVVGAHGGVMFSGPTPAKTSVNGRPHPVMNASVHKQKKRSAVSSLDSTRHKRDQSASNKDSSSPVNSASLESYSEGF